MNPNKRIRLSSKVREPSAGAEPLCRNWRHVNRYGVRMPIMDKVSEWYASGASMLDELPLSPDASALRDTFPILEKKLTYKYIRPLIASLDDSPGHSFKYKDGSRSLSAAAMATYYEDRILNIVGEHRMKEWWDTQPLSKAPIGVGAALTFWYSLDGSNELPDAIVAGLKSTVIAEFQEVFCLTYQRFDNMPKHIVIIDCGKVLPEDRFQMVLQHGNSHMTGFIAVLAEWIKQVAASELEGLREYEAITTFDCDSLWLSKAVPPESVYGHAAATLGLNPVSRLNINMPKRIETMTYEYCRRWRDFCRIATPLRWPRGSPALKSLVRRIKPMVTLYGRWAGGADFDVIMNTMWDTYNNWGLRSGFNYPMAYSPVPWYAWSKPCEANSASNPRWGLEVILASNVICVNAMWQSSKVDAGPSYRTSAAWHKTSLVRALVDLTQDRAEAMSATATKRNDALQLAVASSFLAIYDALSFALASRTIAGKFPVVLEAHTTLLCLKRLVFARVVGDMMDVTGLGIVEKFFVTGHALKFLNDITIDAVRADPAPWIFKNKTTVAIAIVMVAIPFALDYNADRALRGVISGRVGREQMRLINQAQAKLMSWRGRS